MGAARSHERPGNSSVQACVGSSALISNGASADEKRGASSMSPGHKLRETRLKQSRRVTATAATLRRRLVASTHRNRDFRGGMQAFDRRMHTSKDCRGVSQECGLWWSCWTRCYRRKHRSSKLTCMSNGLEATRRDARAAERGLRTRRDHCWRADAEGDPTAWF